MTPTDGIKEKVKYWSNPENRVQLVLWAIVIGLGFWFLGSIASFVYTMLDTWVHIMYLAGEVALVLWVLTSKRVRMVGRLVTRLITGLIVNLDPIGIREDQIKETKKRREKADEAVGNVRGLRTDLKRRIAVNQQKYNDTVDRVVAANALLAKAGISEENQHQAQRVLVRDGKIRKDLEDLIRGQVTQADHYDGAVKKLTRLMELYDDFITRRETEIDIGRQNQKEARALRKVRQVMGVLFGRVNDIGEDMDQMAKQRLEDEYQQELGQFEQFEAITDSMVSQSDFDNLASLQAVQGKLDKFEASAGGKLLSSPSAKLEISASKVPSTVQEDYFK